MSWFADDGRLFGGLPSWIICHLQVCRQLRWFRRSMSGFDEIVLHLVISGFDEVVLHLTMSGFDEVVLHLVMSGLDEVVLHLVMSGFDEVIHHLL